MIVEVKSVTLVEDGGVALRVLASRRDEGEPHTSVDVVDSRRGALVLDTDEPMLSLVTCYPFYYAGHAPKRFIVTALPVAGVPESIAE